MKNTITVLSIFFFLFSCSNRENNTVTTQKEVGEKQKLITPEIVKNNNLIEVSNKTMTLLKNKNFEELSDLIHPTLGIRFSPTAFIDLDSDLNFNTADFIDLTVQKNKVIWGVNKNSGEKIELNFNDYYSTYIYDADYLNAESITENKCLKNSSVINNISEVYNDAEYVEYYFSGFNKQHDGLDWKAIRLVFKKTGNKYHIVALIYN